MTLDKQITDDAVEDDTPVEETKKYTLHMKSGSFCDDCNSFLVPTGSKSLDKEVKGQLFPGVKNPNDLVFHCRKCDEFYTSDSNSIENQTTFFETKAKEEIAVIEKEHQNIGDEIDHNCSSCNNTRAYFHQSPPAFGDEDDLRVYKCTKCGKTERDEADYGM